MRIAVELLTAKHRIQAYGPEGIRVRDEVHTTTLVISAEQIIPAWAGPPPRELDEESLASLLDQDPEVLLIGTGSDSMLLPDRVAVPIQSRGIGLEVMPTAAACRTFNILLGEGRRVVALLYPLSS